MIDVYNANEILHFVQNDTLFFGNDREKRAERVKKTAEGVFGTAEGVFERVLGVKMREWILRFALNDSFFEMKDLDNAWEILHFVQNDTLFFGKERLIVMKTA